MRCADWYAWNQRFWECVQLARQAQAIPPTIRAVLVLAGPGQRDHYISRRAEIWESLYPAEPTRDYSLPSADDGVEQVGQIVPPVAKHGHAQTKSFAAATAELTGESKSTINQYRAIGDALRVADGVAKHHPTPPRPRA